MPPYASSSVSVSLRQCSPSNKNGGRRLSDTAVRHVPERLLMGVVTMVLPPLDIRAFSRIRPQLAGRLRPRVNPPAGTVIDVTADSVETMETVETGIADQADQISRSLREGAVKTVHHFCDLIEDSRDTTWERMGGWYVETGGWMALEGRGAEEFQRLLFSSARAVWRAVNDLSETEYHATTLDAIANAQFVFFDAVTAAFNLGYRSQGPRFAVDQHRDRRLLAEMLLAEEPDLEAVAALARQINWPLPRTIAAVALSPREGRHPRQLMLPGELLIHPHGSKPWLLLPDPESVVRTRPLEPMTGDWIVAVGPAVPVGQAFHSLACARDTLSLVQQGSIPDTGLVRSDDHFPLLVLFRSKAIINSTASERLAPLDEVSPAQRDRLAETLLALLERNFNATAASADLQLHPQTVRYRLHQLQGLFGDDLHDPRARLELQLILHARLALEPDRRRAREAAPPAPALPGDTPDLSLSCP
ncbi:helix-turn-helix domain-containing protein [Actinomadura sp. 9N407]|uniref:helix-turn-helix domain-containing protein n=1 Tax=Actinomadura sp. 9N407 TaxID=3375154 RepID=UPI003792F09A